MPDLLFELSTEELPASYLDRAIETLPDQLKKRLSDLRVLGEAATIRATGTPRRIAVHVSGLLADQRGNAEEVMGPPVSAAFKDGKPTKAAEAFAAKVGLPIDKIEQRETPKGKYLVGTKRADTKPTAAILPEALVETIRGIEFPKTMTWVPGSKLRFARPLRAIVALLDSEVVPLEWNGIRSARTTFGHPFLAPGSIELRSASWPEYVEALRKRKVAVDRDERRAEIAQKLAASGANAHPAVLEIAANLVEWPEVMTGTFDAKFLDIPHEVIMAALRGHLRAFEFSDPAAPAGTRITNRFAFVTNRPGNDTIRSGYERVLKARLSDAYFFSMQDRKTKLEELAPKLKEVTFARDLGSYFEKQVRVRDLALQIAHGLGWNDSAPHIVNAAAIMKADLLTQVVGEFPELQGTVGMHYARADGHQEEVWRAIRDAYLPRHDGDLLPETRTGIALSIAEKIDNAVAAFATGQKPTGSKDPLGVRRQLIGVLRILKTKDLSVPLGALLEMAARQLPDAAVAPRKKLDPKAPAPDLAAIRRQVAADVREYAKGRLVTMSHETGQRPDLTAAVLASGWEDVPDFWARLSALTELAASPQFPKLVTLVERTRNITKGVPAPGEPSEAALKEDAEKALFQALASVRPKIKDALAARRYREAGTLYEQALTAPVERFMKDVFVNDPDAAVRANRLALVFTVYALLAHGFADLAEVSATAKPAG
jgi:glycyl-tRNA synthetase beta chain